MEWQRQCRLSQSQFFQTGTPENTERFLKINTVRMYLSTYMYVRVYVHKYIIQVGYDDQALAKELVICNITECSKSFLMSNTHNCQLVRIHPQIRMHTHKRTNDDSHFVATVTVAF